MRRVPMIAIWFLLAALLIADLLMMLGVGSMNGPDGGIQLGLVFGQAALIAVCVAWAPWTARRRWFVGVFYLVWLVICLAAALAHSRAPTEVMWISGLPLAVWLANVMPFSFMRWSKGTRIRCRDDHVESDQKQQFGIRQLMLATFIIAVLLAVSRGTIAEFDASSGLGADQMRLIVVATILFAFSVVTAWVVVCYCLAAKHLGRWAIPVILLCTAVTALEIATYRWSVRDNFRELPWFFTLLQAVQLVVLAGPLLVLRAAGCHLVRRKPIV